MTHRDARDPLQRAGDSAAPHDGSTPTEEPDGALPRTRRESVFSALDPADLLSAIRSSSRRVALYRDTLHGAHGAEAAICLVVFTSAGAERRIVLHRGAAHALQHALGAAISAVFGAPSDRAHRPGVPRGRTSPAAKGRTP